MSMELIYLSRARIPSRKAHVTHMHKMCDALRKQGIGVTFVHPFRWRRYDPELHDPKDHYNLKYNPRYRTLPALDLPVLKSIHVRLWFWTYASTFTLCVLLYLLVRQFTAPGPIVFYSRDHLVAYAILKLNFLFRVPLFLDLHDLPDSVRDHRKQTFQTIDGFVVNGPGIRGELMDAGYRSEDILVAPNGVNPEDFDISLDRRECRAELSLPRESFIAGFTGTPYEYNGRDILLELARRNPEMHFVSVGGRPEQLEPMRSYRQEHGLDNVTLVEHQPHSRIPVFLKSFDCCLLPLTADIKRTVRYATPLKLFEYLAAGRPIVASDLPSLSHFLTHGDNALLVPPGSPEAFGSALERLKTDPELRRALSRSARRHAGQFTWSKRARRVLDFLRVRSGQNGRLSEARDGD